MEKYYLVDENGEIINEIDTTDGDRIIVDKQSTRDNKIKTKSFICETDRMDYSFTKINTNNIERVANVAPNSFKLFAYVGYIDNILKYNNGNLINMRSIGKILGGSKEHIRRTVNKLEEEDIIRKYGRGEKAYFVVNPWICHKGKRISRLALEEFKDSDWRGKNNDDTV